MPVWETLLLRENNSLGAGDSGDIDIKLPENRAIHKLLLTIRNQNGSTSNTDDAGALETVVNSITELKVQSGSRIFKEFSGQLHLPDRVAGGGLSHRLRTGERALRYRVRASNTAL
jgi:hypothetical protein